MKIFIKIIIKTPCLIIIINKPWFTFDLIVTLKINY